MTRRRTCWGKRRSSATTGAIFNASGRVPKIVATVIKLDPFEIEYGRQDTEAKADHVKDQDRLSLRKAASQQPVVQVALICLVDRPPLHEPAGDHKGGIEDRHP